MSRLARRSALHQMQAGMWTGRLFPLFRGMRRYASCVRRMVRARIISFRAMMKGFNLITAQMDSVRAMLAGDTGRGGARTGAGRVRQERGENRQEDEGETAHAAG